MVKCTENQEFYNKKVDKVLKNRDLMGENKVTTGDRRLN